MGWFYPYNRLAGWEFGQEPSPPNPQPTVKLQEAYVK
jgi:hypothetical protein